MQPDQCAVVIPSCRTVTAERLRRIPPDTPIYVVSDTETAIDPVRPSMQVFDLAFQRKVMGADYDLIPRGTSACRNFGFFYVWRYTDHACVVSLDDDVEAPDDFLDGFAHLGESGTFDTATGLPWFNTLDLFAGCDGLYPRGFPFTERTAAQPRWERTTARTVCHMGLWDDVLDTHAIDKQLFDEYRAPRPSLPLRRGIARIGTERERTKIPLCSMNFGFVRDALPLAYQMPMPAAFMDRYPLARYEDIWAGYIAQTLIAIRGEAVTAGAPVVRHVKDGALLGELRGEHYGTLLSPFLYAAVDAAADRVTAGPYLEMYAQFADAALTPGADVLRRIGMPMIFRDYLDGCFRAISRWCDLHASSGSGRVRPARISGA
jgi:hypothetical protein